MGFTEILVIGAVIVLFFGIRHLPALLGALGKSTKEFKKGLRGDPDNPTRDVEEIRPDKKQD